MESARYHRLAELPEPDYFDIQLEKDYLPPASRLIRTKRWIHRNVVLVILLTAFIIAAILYTATWLAARPILAGLGRPENASLKLAEISAGSQHAVQAGQAGLGDPGIDHDDTVVNTNHGGEGAEVSGANMTATANDESKSPGAGAGNSGTNSDNRPTTAQDGQAGDSVFDEATSSEKQPDKGSNAAAEVEQDDGQVSIQDANPAQQEPFIPIKATFYSGSEGPKACRGGVIAVINMQKPSLPGAPTTPQCYNFPSLQSSGCATFLANKADGCEASVYAETNCRSYMNTMAFMPENRPVGGNWRSVKVQCGLPEPDMSTLGKPPMMDSITSVVENN